MKKILVVFCILLALLMTGCAGQKSASEPKSSAQLPVPTDSDGTGEAAAIVNGYTISYKEYMDFVTYCASLYSMAGQDVTSDADSLKVLMDSAMDMLIEKEMLLQQAQSLGLDQLSNDERAALDENYDVMIAELLSPFIQTATAEKQNDPSIDIQNRANERLDQDLAVQGMSRAKLRQDLYDDYIISNKLYACITGEINLTDEYIEAWYKDKLQTQRSAIEADQTAYEAFVDDGLALYVPEGYVHCRYLFIMTEWSEEAMEERTKLKADEAQLAEQIQILIEDDMQANAAEIEKLNFKLMYLKENLADLAEEQKSAARTKADDLAIQLKQGAGFDELLEGEGLSEDFGAVCAVGHNSDYPEAFRSAAMALTEDNMFTGAVELDDGFCIIERLKAPTPGALPYEDVQPLCAERALEQSRSEAWALAVESWHQDSDIEIIKT